MDRGFSAHMTTTITRMISALLATFFVAGLLSGCTRFDNVQQADHPRFTVLSDIPDVDDADIRDIEALRAQRSSFVFGTTTSTESFVTADGKIGGFTALLCDWLTELIGIPFEIKFYDWSELLLGLESGEIDFTGELTPTEERRGTYIMTDAIAGRSVKYMRIAGNVSLSTIADLRLPRYAFLRDTTTYEDVRNQIGDSVEYVLVDGYDEAYQLLKSGAVDAFIDEGPAEAAFDIYGDVIAEDFYPLIYGPVSLTTQNPLNRPVITIVQKALKNDGLYYLMELYNEGALDYLRHKFIMSLTAEEIEYIQNNRIVNFASEYDNYPVSFYNTRVGEWQGISFDVLSEVEALTGLYFRRVSNEMKSWPTLLRMLETGEASIISELIRTQDREGMFLWPETPLFADQYSLLSKSEFRNVNINEVWLYSVGLIEGTAHAEMFGLWFPNHANTTIYSTFDDAYMAMRDGEVDLVMASRNQLLVLTHHEEIAGYKNNLVFSYPLASTFGFYIGDDILCSIVDKALRLIDTTGIADEWISRTYDYRGRLSEAQLPWLIGVIALLITLVIVLTLLIILFNRNRRSERHSIETEMRETALMAENEMLDRLNIMKIELFQNMSHDFKTPLTVISTSVLNAIDILDFEIDKDEIRESLVIAQQEIMRMARMVDGAMKHATLHDNRKDMSLVDIEKLLNDVADTYQALFERHGNVITLDIQEQIPLVYSNADMLLHVLSNLLSNSNRYTRNGEIKIRAELCDENEGPANDLAIRFVSITVKDTGEGIKSELLPFVFERGVTDFGTGLGLAICKTAVEEHDGSISIESEYGKGTAVTVHLPVGNETRIIERRRVAGDRRRDDNDRRKPF